MKAYAKSGGYAEQALNGIRVVSAFGQEDREVQNYEKYLGEAQRAGVRTNAWVGFGYALFTAALLLCYAYCFYFGALFIKGEVYNEQQGRVYSGGDVIAVFFGVFFGVFAVGMSVPSIKALNEGLVAGHFACEVIDREPRIPLDANPDARASFLGAIEFREVSFKYPSREDTVLRNVSFTIESGKTTAIVGPSGSGKSTCVQLLERFYDPVDGSVLVDGVDLRSLNLRSFRS